MKSRWYYLYPISCIVFCVVIAFQIILHESFVIIGVVLAISMIINFYLIGVTAIIFSDIVDLKYKSEVLNEHLKTIASKLIDLFNRK